MAVAPGQHVGLQTDDARAFYDTLGSRAQPHFRSRVVDRWLDNDANPKPPSMGGDDLRTWCHVAGT